MTADDLIRLIEIRTSPKLRSLQKRIESGTATLRDSFEYSAAVAGIAGRVLSENIIGINPEERELICTALLRQNHREVNDIFAQVQENIDRRNGLTLRPRQGEFPAERVQQFAHSLVDPTVEESVIRRRARSGTENITLSFHDDSVRENAKFRNDAGLICYLDRQTNGKCCPWCSDAAGRYLYGTEPRDIYRRHDNCNCTVIFENGRQRQNVWTKRSWEAPEVGSGNKPKVFSEDEARSIEQRNLSQIRGISVDNSGESGIIEARGYIEDNFDRKANLSTTDEDLKAVNPNWKELKGYDDNCQRCVPTYVLRRQGYDVEALPTGLNEEIDNLLKQNPHIIWERAGNSVIPRSTRGSKYFGKPEIEKYMKDLPDGAMCEIRCEWKDRDYGHVFIAEKQNGKVRYIDPQTGKTEVSRYFKDMKPNRTQFWRIDNATLNDDLIKYCCKSKG